MRDGLKNRPAFNFTALNNAVKIYNTPQKFLFFALSRSSTFKPFKALSSFKRDCALLRRD